MKRETLFRFNCRPYRQEIPIYGYRFGGTEKTLAIMGSTRGDEYQQMYVCALLVKRLKKLESEGRIPDGVGILIIPCAGQFSMNVGKRFWPMDNTDINRMFPGYSGGETTQRVAAALFETLKGYKYGIQMASFYLAGDFLPHVRIMDTGYQDPKQGEAFGLPYLMIRAPRSYDTTTLNYNWQLWETEAYSLYTNATDTIDEGSAYDATDAIIRFLYSHDLIQIDEADVPLGSPTKVLTRADLVNIHTKKGGIMRRLCMPGMDVEPGDELAQILDPYTAELRESIVSPVRGKVFFARKGQIMAEHEVAFRIIAEREK